MEEIRLTISATLVQAQLGTIAAAEIAKAYYRQVEGADQQLASTFADAVELAVGEACTNSVKYCPAAQAESCMVLICFELGARELVVRVRDCNPPFDPASTPIPDFEKVPEGGYGIHIMKECMDQVSYERVDGWNVVTLRKSIPEEE